MGLMLPRSNVAPLVNSYPATPGAPGGNTTGVRVTAAGTSNTKGTYAVLFASTPYDSYGMVFQVSQSFAAASARHMLLDIAVGAAASEQVVVPDIPVGSANQISNGSPQYYLPIFIPKGSRVTARVQAAVLTQAVTVNAMLLGGASLPNIFTFQESVSIGTTVADSKATPLLVGSSGTFSAWTSIGATLAHDLRAYVVCIQGDTGDTAWADNTVHLEVGYGSVAISTMHSFAISSAEGVLATWPVMPVWCRVPAGTQMQIRATSGTTGDTLQFALMGFY